MLTIRLYTKKSDLHSELTSVYLNGVAYIDLEKKYISYSPDGKIDWKIIHFDNIDCDYTNSCFDVYVKE